MLSLIFASFLLSGAKEPPQYLELVQMVPVTVSVDVDLNGETHHFQVQPTCTMSNKYYANGWRMSGRREWTAEPFSRVFADGSALLISFKFNMCTWEDEKISGGVHHSEYNVEQVFFQRNLPQVFWIDNVDDPHEIEQFVQHYGTEAADGRIKGVSLEYRWDAEKNPKGTWEGLDATLKTGDFDTSKPIYLEYSRLSELKEEGFDTRLAPFLALKTYADPCELLEMGFLGLPLTRYEPVIWRRNPYLDKELPKGSESAWVIPAERPELARGLEAARTSGARRPAKSISFELMKLMGEWQKEGKEIHLPNLWPSFQDGVWDFRNMTKNARFFKVSDEALVSKNTQTFVRKDKSVEKRCDAPFDVLRGTELKTQSTVKALADVLPHMFEPRDKIWFYEADTDRLFMMENAFDVRAERLVSDW